APRRRAPATIASLIGTDTTGPRCEGPAGAAGWTRYEGPARAAAHPAVRACRTGAGWRVIGAAHPEATPAGRPATGRRARGTSAGRPEARGGRAVAGA